MSLCDEVKRARSGKEIVKIIESDSRFEGWRDSGSSHRMARFQNGTTAPVPLHGNRDMPIGTKMKIIRILRAGGLCTLIVALSLLMLVQLLGG